VLGFVGGGDSGGGRTSGNIGSSFIWMSGSIGMPLVSGIGSGASVEGMGASAIVDYGDLGIYWFAKEDIYKL
jgi:hypothetical protein